MDEDIPERTAGVDSANVEGITIDGAEGSPADHAEGFPGGPRDPLVLTSFGDHVAHSIWSGEERLELKLVSHGRKIDKFGRPAPEIEGLVAATGLSPLIRCCAGVYAWGAAALVHMYDQLNEACKTPTRQMVGYLTLLQCWIYEHFPNVHQCVTDDAYAEMTPRASQWLTMKAHMRGITRAPYQERLDALTITDGQLRWGPIVVFVRPERVVRQFGYIQTIPPPPVSASLSYEEIDDRWMHFLDHVAPATEICVVPGQNGCEGCEAIAERLERVLNLRMVTEGIELHEIMQDCLRIARGDASDGSLRARRRCRIDH
ncbi:uncharacterized protein LOC114397092 [Glycine soja]|uniref:uncharacterized protein LOC114397092 n=1 Tax=Glycine soja TaxID=3848 RepID=UPI00103F27D8|nr:uncharacterized protein LOC114397092 [Glycine soja]